MASAATTDRVTAIHDALSTLDRADAVARDADTAVQEAQGRLSGARRAESEAESVAATATAAVAHERDVTRQLAVASYVTNGSADDHERETTAMVLGARVETMARVTSEERVQRRRLDAATKERTRLETDLARVTVAKETADAARLASEHDADVQLSSAGAGDLPAISYLAYRSAADEVNAADPTCHLPAAVLAAIGRVRWMHGWQSTTRTDLVVADTSPDVPRDPYDVERAITPVAARLCAGGGTLDQAAPLAAAIRTQEPDPTRADIVIAVARRYSRTAGLDLGSVPAGVEDAATIPQFDDSGPLASGDVAAMIAWGRSRIGTPYSQCLGQDVRPQDPVCPDGTNRFGRGFFDCSGFVSAAYRKIGILVPTTTMAMDASERFMATKVASTFDPNVLRAGDVFLMDGHTGMYVGDGYILHARGGGLTWERIPAWVANATYAILRPIDLR